MANINASALNSLQTRINAERSRRSLSAVTFTDGTLSAGGTIKATHFAELRTYTEGLNTLGSQTFNWSGTVSVGASITDVITQISNFVTTLEGEALAGWKDLSPISYDGGFNFCCNLTSRGARWVFQIPSPAFSANKVRVSLGGDWYSPLSICNTVSESTEPAVLRQGSTNVTQVASVLTAISSSATPSLTVVSGTFGVAQHTFPKVIGVHANLKGFRRGAASPASLPNANIYCNPNKWNLAQGYGNMPRYINEECMYAMYGTDASAIGPSSYFYNETGGFSSSWQYLVIAMGLSEISGGAGPMPEPNRTGFIKVEAYY
jgi:hypothetical protein